MNALQQLAVAVQPIVALIFAVAVFGTILNYSLASKARNRWNRYKDYKGNHLSKQDRRDVRDYLEDFMILLTLGGEQAGEQEWLRHLMLEAEHDRVLASEKGSTSLGVAFFAGLLLLASLPASSPT